MSHYETTLQNLANRVKALRLRRKWTRQELARLANVNVYSLKRFERTGQISLERLLSLCEALGVLSDFDRILKPRERVDIDQWKVMSPPLRQRGQRSKHDLVDSKEDSSASSLENRTVLSNP